MLVIRNIKKPLLIKTYGLVQSGGLGEVPEGYEEVELNALPEGYELETPEYLKGQTVLNKMVSIVQSASVDMRVAFAVPRATVTHLLNSNDMEAAKAYITGLALPENLKHALLGCFE